MTGETTDPKTERRRRFTCGRCLLISIIVVLGICLIAYFLPFGISHFRAQNQQRIWNKLGSDNYSLTLDGGPFPNDLYFDSAFGSTFGGITFEVCAGKIVRINGEPCEDSSHPEKCANDPVDVLFHEARWCGYGCEVKFNKDYGFPHWILYEDFDLSQNLWATDYAPINCP